MDTLQLAILIIIGYVCVYGVINRICKTIENCAMARCFSAFGQSDPEDIKRVIAGFKDATETKK